MRRATIRGVVDSGAGLPVLPKFVVRKLGLPLAGKVKVRYADGRTRMRDRVEDVQVEIQGRCGTYTAIAEPNRTGALIRSIVLQDLDYLVDWEHRRLVPRDPRFILSEIESL